MSEDQEILNTARLLILDKSITQQIFNTLRGFYANQEPDVKYILNLLEASLLNAIAERKLFFNALILALKTDQEKQKAQGEIEQALTQLQDKIHSVDGDVKQLKERGVEDIIKKFIEGKQ
jgi:hypothetical protein